MECLNRIGFSIRGDIRSCFVMSYQSVSFPFHLYVQFDVAHNHSVVTSNVGLVYDCYVCDYVWPVCWDVGNFGFRYTDLSFSCPSPPCFLLEHGVQNFVFS